MFFVFIWWCSRLHKRKCCLSLTLIFRFCFLFRWCSNRIHKCKATSTCSWLGLFCIWLRCHKWKRWLRWYFFIFLFLLLIHESKGSYWSWWLIRLRLWVVKKVETTRSWCFRWSFLIFIFILLPSFISFCLHKRKLSKWFLIFLGSIFIVFFIIFVDDLVLIILKFFHFSWFWWLLFIRFLIFFWFINQVLNQIGCKWVSVFIVFVCGIYNFLFSIVLILNSTCPLHRQRTSFLMHQFIFIVFDFKVILLFIFGFIL